VRIPRYLRVIGWTALFWIAVLAAIVVLVLETSDGSPTTARNAGEDNVPPEVLVPPIGPHPTAGA